jgi:outer membrane receptor for ferrienterochelin and colicin
MGSWSYSETFGGGGWKGYDNYLAVKNQRINEQLKNQIEDTLLESGKKEMIFENCVFWLDGRTRIAEERLKELMVLYGGEYEASTLSRVTHIVADNLALGNQRWRQIRYAS